jgi:hypothetical protein
MATQENDAPSKPHTTFMKNRSHISNEHATATGPAFWEREGVTACLGVELSSGETHLFSYQHFINASLFRGANGIEILRICFSGHDVEIDGRGLRDLLVGLQNFGVKWVRTVPARYGGLIEKSDVGIMIIRIRGAEFAPRQLAD